MERKLFNDFVLSVIEEFHVFVGQKNSLPHLSIVYDDNLPDCAIYEETPGGHFITLNQKILEQYTDFGKGIIFHELTHFYDHIMHVPQLSIEERKALLLHYTEFHAAFVQMQCWCGFRAIDEVRRITPLHKIPHTDEEIPISAFYAEETKIASRLTLFYCTGKVENSFVRHVKRAMYYAGEIWFAKKNAKFDVDPFINIAAFSSYLGNDVVDLMRLFMTDEPIDESILRKSTEYNPLMSGFATCVHRARDRYNADK